jgi:hypothetical protein
VTRASADGLGVQGPGAGLADLYRFFRAGAGMLTCLYRDFAALPEQYQRALRDQDTLFGDVLTAPFATAGREYRRLRAVTGHATSFWTWHSLCLDHGLTDTEAVDAMTGMILATTRSADRPRFNTRRAELRPPSRYRSETVVSYPVALPSWQIRAGPGRRHDGCTDT